MAENYRIKYKVGDFEIEIESTDKEFVELKLKQLVEEKQIQPPVIQTQKVASKTTPIKTNEALDDSENGDIEVVSVVNAINDADNHSIIEKKILQKVNQLNRILLIFYFVNKLNPSATITTGDIENITHQLGIRIKRNNAGTCIKDNTKYFAAETVRKQGAVIKYKINRKGIEEFERIIAS